MIIISVQFIVKLAYRPQRMKLLGVKYAKICILEGSQKYVWSSIIFWLNNYQKNTLIKEKCFMIMEFLVSKNVHQPVSVLAICAYFNFLIFDSRFSAHNILKC